MGLLFAIAARLWLGPVDLIDRTYAQIPDSGMQRKLLLDESKRTNQLLSEIAGVLRTQTIKVRLETPDKTSIAVDRKRDK